MIYVVVLAITAAFVAAVIATMFIPDYEVPATLATVMLAVIGALIGGGIALRGGGKRGDGGDK